MPEIVDRWGAAMLDAALAATAISGLVALAMVQCRQPARRRSWARAGLLSMLALLPLAALNPFPRFDLRRPIRTILPNQFEGRWSHPPRRPSGVDRVPHARAFPGRRDPAEKPRRGVDHCPPPAGPIRHLGRALALLYLAGLGVGLGLLGLGVWGSSWLVRRASTPSKGAATAYAGLEFRSLMARPRLLVSDRVGRPVLLGLVRPAILIPPDLDRPDSANSLVLSLLHELAHAEAADHLFGLAANLAQAAWFFLPPVWWIRRQMRLDQEFLADRRAAESFGTSGHYASSLVGLASSRSLDRAEPPAAREEADEPGPGSSLTQRVLMLIRCPFPIERRSPLWWHFVAASTLGLVTLVASCLTLRGFVDGSSSETATEADAGGSFRLPRLDLGQGGGDAPPFDLRFRLPDQFLLTFEVLAGPGDLPSIEVLGHRLGPAHAPADDPSPIQPTWHRVRIRRSGGIEDVEVDDRPVAGPSRAARPLTWLTIRPPAGLTIRIRDLELNW